MDKPIRLKLLSQGLDQLIPDNFMDRVQGPPMRIKYGADPSAPDLHLGHYVGLRKLRFLQDLGHHILFLIGDFTAMIGDPTGKSETRKPLSAEQVKINAKTYQDQVFKVLNPASTEVVYNSHWLNQLTPQEFLQLTAKTTVARMLERDDFHKRYTAQQAIGLHEFLYPLLQGYDSVALKSDLELCGTDQTFNVLMGRQLQKEYGQAPQGVMVTPLLEGLDGVNKMSKSLGNTIGLTEAPDQMFGKIMSIPDALMMRYFTLLTDRCEAELKTLQDRLDQGENPRNLKVELGLEIVEALHSAPEAQDAKAAFERIFTQRLVPEELEALPVPSTAFRLDNLLVEKGILPSKKEALRLAAQNAITLDGEIVSDLLTPKTVADGQVLKIGKRRFFQLKHG